MRTRDSAPSKEKPVLWPRAIHLCAGKQSLYLSCWHSSTTVAEFIAIEPHATSGTPKVVEHAFKGTMHQRANMPRHSSTRTGPTACTGTGQHAGVRQCTAAKKEGGSLVRRTEESDRTASPAPEEIEVCSRAVLPGSGGPEHQTTGAVPQPTDNPCSACHHLAQL